MGSRGEGLQGAQRQQGRFGVPSLYSFWEQAIKHTANIINGKHLYNRNKFVRIPLSIIPGGGDRSRNSSTCNVASKDGRSLAWGRMG